MAFTQAGKQKKNSGSQKTSKEPEQGANEMNGRESPRPPHLEVNAVEMDYHGEKIVISIQAVLPANIERPCLSKREAEVLQCLALGMSPDQIAEDLVISTRTVRKYLDILEEKFGSSSRDQMMARAGYLRLCNPYKEIS